MYKNSNSYSKTPFSRIHLVEQEEYDIDVWDVENKKIIKTCKGGKECEMFTGLSRSYIFSCIKIKTKIRASKNKLGIIITLRKSKNNV